MKNGSLKDNFGNEYWYKNDMLHREDGPAYEFNNGARYWFKNNKFHREDGPAIETKNGTYFEYWLYGKKLNFPNDIRLTKEQMELYITFM